MYFDFISRPRNNQQGDLYNGFLLNRNSPLYGPSEMLSFHHAFQSADAFFNPCTDYGMIYRSGRFSRQAHLQDFTSASPAAEDIQDHFRSKSRRANSKRWDSTGLEILVTALYSSKHTTATKSSTGKKRYERK